MPATLTIHDETSSGQKTHSFTLECLTERMFTKYIIVVDADVDMHNTSER